MILTPTQTASLERVIRILKHIGWSDDKDQNVRSITEAQRELRSLLESFYTGGPADSKYLPKS